METFIKGFDKDLKCRDFQFEIGKTYEINNKEKALKLCTDTVFHFCRGLEQVHNHYSVRGTENRFCEIEVLGGLVEDNTKCGSDKIRIIREIVGEELANLKGLKRGNTGFFNTGNYNTGDYNTGYYNTGYYNTGNYNTGYYNTGDYNTGYYNTGYYNTGNYNTGDYNTGYYNTGYYNTGDYNTGDRNTGDYNTGDYNTGDRNTGDRNTGDYNTGDYNTGDRNTGYYNTGNYNTGDYNTGDRNTGNYNTGNYNKCDHSTGFFNTKERNITLFNKDSGMTHEEFRKSIYFNAIYSVDFILTKWVYYTDKEKENSPVRQAMGGYLKKYSYFAACENWWKDLSEKNKEIIQSIPNFDKEIFKEITGIEL